ncbi:MAG: OmpA family protein [Pseudomonadota bacterium]
MLHPFFRLLTVAAALLILGGCVAKSDYLQKQSEADTLQRQLSAMTDENARLKEQIDRLSVEKEKLTAEKNNLTADSNDLDARLVAKTEELARTIAETTHAIEELKYKNAELEGDKQMLRESIALLKKTKEEEVQTVSRTYEDLLNEMTEEVEQGQITITELKGKLTVDVLDKILFDSGRAEVKSEGLEVLKRVVEILKTVTDKIIRVEGHTDNVPIGGILAKRYPTNWELSAARAINITRYLEKEGLDPALLSAAAFGEYQPVADNETPEGRAKNRRIAIILLPKE